MVCLCTIELDFSKPIVGNAYRENASFVRDLEAWRKVADGNLFIWDYLADFASYMMPHPNLYAIAPNIRLFAKNGAVGVFEQGDATCAAGEFAPLKCWLLAQLLFQLFEEGGACIDGNLFAHFGTFAAIVRRVVVVVIVGVIAIFYRAHGFTVELKGGVVVAVGFDRFIVASIAAVNVIVFEGRVVDELVLNALFQFLRVQFEQRYHEQLLC